jgi:hypothetical protein
MNLQFDIRGNLQAPPDFIEMGWTDFIAENKNFGKESFV